MPAIQIPGTNITYGWQEREDGWANGMNTNLVVLGYLAKGSVLSRSVDTPPVDPDEGDRYIVPANPFGEWGGHSNKVAMYLSGAWIYIEPFQIPMLVIDEDVHVYWNGDEYELFKGAQQVAELEALVASAQQAATTATENADKTSEDRIATGEDRAQTGQDADRAENARDAAQLAAGVYEDTAAGIAATSDGDYFTVPSEDEDDFLILYRNDTGAAVEIETYPSAAAIRKRVLAVPDIAALRALTGVQDGQVVYLESLNSDYVAVSGSSEEDDGFATIVSSDGTRFYRKGTQNPGYQDASIAFVETLDTGLSPDTPANLRDGLSPDRYEEGGFEQEMEIAVTGVSGSATLSSTDTSKVSGLGGTGFSAVLVSAAGVGSFATVTGHNGSDEIYLDHPLTEDFSGVLSSKYDSALGQHLTKNATTAYAQHVARATGLVASRKSVLNGTWNSLPSSYNAVWGRNQALIDYGVNNSPAPVVQSDILDNSAGNLVGSEDRLAHRPLSDACGVRIGCLEAGHGAVASVPLAGKAAVVDFWTGAFRSSTALTGVSMSVVVKGDGRTLYSDTHSHVLRHVTVPVADVDEVTIEATNTDGQIYYMELSQLIVREPGAQGRLIQRDSRVVTLGDSWFAFYDGWFSKMLAKQTGATVINYALGGQTTEWALAWFDEYVAKENPDVCVFHFFTNDANDLSASTFTAPDGSSLPKWPSGLTSDESLAHWRRNILELAYRCQSIGVKPVFVLPGGTAALAQSTRHAQWRWGIDFGTPNADFPATAGLLADSQSFPNQHGKYTGKPILVGTSYRNAQGAAPGDDWLNNTEAALVPLQKRSLSVSDYSAPNSFTIGTDTDEDGLSDGITEQSYGGSGASGDVFTPSIVSGAQRWESNYSATQSGNTRLAFSADLVAGKEYIAIALISNTGADAQFDCVSYISGSATPFTNIRSNAYAGPDGTGTLYARETAGATGPASINVGSYPQAETVKSVDFDRVFFVDLEALFQVAPNAASMSDDELADFCAGMQP